MRFLKFFVLVFFAFSAFFFGCIEKENKNNPSPQVIDIASPSPKEFIDSNEVKVYVGDAPVIGWPNASVVIVEFSDFECEYCRSFYVDTFVKLIKEYEGRIAFAYKDFPLPYYKNSYKAAEASKCAKNQGKFWEYLDLLYVNQSEWAKANNSEEKFYEYAKQIGLNEVSFKLCLKTGLMNKAVKKDFSEGYALGVRAVPTFFINGVKIVGNQSFEVFKKEIDLLLNKSI